MGSIVGANNRNVYSFIRKYGLASSGLLEPLLNWLTWDDIKLHES